MMKLKFTSSLLLLVLTLQNNPFWVVGQEPGEPPLDLIEGCNVTDYYSGLPDDPATWTREEVFSLIKSTHIRVPVFTSVSPGSNDIWEALVDVDFDAGDDKVTLVYNDVAVDGVPFGIRHWVKEHLWPISRGVGRDGPDYTDVHALRAANPTSNDVRANRYFGICGILDTPGDCQEPAESSAEDTCKCNRNFQPPEVMRGSIARALMYMDLRYDGSDPNTVDLRLTDCPFNPPTDMAYLSQMIEWHLADLPSANEIARNQRICERWQGNRNPFIDFPQLYETLFTDPILPLPIEGDGRLIYEACEDIPTNAPTFTPNSCQDFNEDNIFFFLINSDDPDSVGLFTLIPIPEDLELFMTDNAWTGTDFLDTEGVLAFEMPAGGINASTVFGYGGGLPMSDRWSTFQGRFSLSTEGEQIILYCLTAASEKRPLTAISYNGPFSTPGLSRYGFNESSAPEGINTIVLEHFDNYVYAGRQNGTNAQIREAILDAENWDGSNEARFNLAGVNQVLSSGANDIIRSLSMTIITMVGIVVSTVWTMI